MVPLVTRHTTHPHHVGVGGSQGETVLSALAANAGRDPGRPAMRHRQDGHWVVTTWGGYLARVREVATGLASLGVGARSRVAILSANRPEWHIADLAAMSVGAATVPLYPTSSVAQVAYALRHARVEVCIVDGHDAAGKVLEAARQATDVRHVVLIDGATRYTDSSLITFEELAATGAERLGGGDTTAEEAAATVRPDDLATIVYTSGTTGPPKGVMISHRNIMWTLRQVTPVYGVGEGDRLLSFLPLSHIAERMMSEFTPIGSGGETWFARSLATVAEDLPACRPDLFLAVPRVWEKLRDSVEAQVGGLPLPARVAVDGYIRLGLVRVAAAAAGRSPGPVPEAAWTALDRSVGVAIRRRIGLDRARVVVSAAAPIHPDLVRWFHAIGLPMLQIYGQTEGCGPTTANRPGDPAIGTVGQALPGIRVEVAGDGEILLKGGNVCMGYLDDPDATAELIDPDGWLHTGDTGELDGDGNLRIVGRKKDLIITAAGKNIAPQDIETDLTNHPLVSEAVVVGEGRRYLSALVTLDTEELSRWAARRSKLGDTEALATDPDLQEEIQRLVDSVNAKRSHAEGIRKFRVLPRDLTAASGELTPTMKVKRQVVYRHYADVIDDIYAAA